MIAIAAIAIAAGCASALMFASIISGALISLVLFYLAPLPLMVAALGWGPLSAAMGGIAAASTLGLLFGMPYGIAYTLTVALPAWWLGHLVMLGRPVANTAHAGNGAAPPAPAMEWYPSGRLLLWVAVFAVITTMSALLTLGTDPADIAASMKRFFLRVLGPSGTMATADLDRVIDAFVAIAPSGAALVAMLALTINLWLAAKITATSGRLNRSWPDIRSTALPPMTLVALCVAIALCFTGGLLALIAQVATSALLMAYALTGFAVLHTLTLASTSRAIWLGLTYAIMFIFFWPVLAMIVLGLADAIFGLRERFMRTRPPPLPAA
ncbi:MAG: hypothetical protein QOF09_5325 [Alphaproteobacteria bacterium]|nr:hypothetical protein [Alphaproteobacteria bacterium]